jgi:hypothetical protein
MMLLSLRRCEVGLRMGMYLSYIIVYTYVHEPQVRPIPSLHTG